MLVEGASLSLIETQVLCLPVEFAQRGCWQRSQHPHRYLSTLIRQKPEQQVPQGPFPFSSVWILKRCKCFHLKSKCWHSWKRAERLLLCSLLAACWQSTSAALWLGSSTAAPDALLCLRRPQFSPLPLCFHLLLPDPLCVHTGSCSPLSCSPLSPRWCRTDSDPQGSCLWGGWVFKSPLEANMIVRNKRHRQTVWG